MDMPARNVIPFDQLEHFLGFDWAGDKHDVCLINRDGKILLQMQFDDTVEGWTCLREKLRSFANLAVAIETSRGPVVERLLEMQLTLYPMNPKAAERFRDRKAPSGVKDDTLDAWCFADALRSDGHAWRPLLPEHPQTQLLRMLCRDEISLIEQRTALVHQLKAALREYYPAARDAFEDWTAVSSWEFVIAFPTPEHLANAGKRKWEKFLHTHKLYRAATAPGRLEIFAKAREFASPSMAVTAAKSLLALTLARTLKTLEQQIQEYRRRIEQTFKDHPDGGVFASLPGGGKKLAPRLLGEMGDNREVFASAQALQCYAGTAPVTRKSGRSCSVKVRWACNKVLRATVHLWADESRQKCAWAQVYYQQKKEQGKSHAQALRCLGQRWLKILWKMWRAGAPYDEALHMKSLLESGSWVMKLLPSPQPKTAH